MVRIAVFFSAVAAANAGACSADDQKALSDSATVGAAGSKCGLKAFGLKFDHGKFNDCFTAELGVSSDCSECYATNGEYASKNCKAACLLGWCKQGCLDCSTAAAPKAALDACTGFTSGTAQPCLETTGACNADDQAALADPQNVGEKQDACGKKALSLTKGIDHDKFTSCVQSDLGISAACSECYYATADYGFNNCKSACLLGWCKSGCLSCTKPAQDDLATCAGFATGTAQPCLETAGACNADDQAALADPQNVGEKQDACGKKALSLTGIDHDKFTSCVQSDLSISAACSECYYATADYGFKNCKAACLLGWCKSGCLSCTKPAQDDLATCAGFATGTAQPCLETTGACNADDQAALADPQNVGEKQDACGKKALSLTGIDHDKFTSCVQSDLSISAACSECYYATADYGFKNCKAACLLGWCKSGCLSCTKPAQDDLATCAGFATGTAEPCMDKFLA